MSDRTHELEGPTAYQPPRRRRAPLQGPKPLPIGRRPRCRCCDKELRPYFVSKPEPGRPWRSDVPKELAGYGGYGDGFFCGLNCGYEWARRHLERDALAPCLVKIGGRP